MTDRLKEARAVLELVEESESPNDAMRLLQTAGYSEKNAECLLDSAPEILHIAQT